MSRLFTAFFVAATVSGAAWADESVLLSVCQDGPAGAVTTSADLARTLSGTWRMTAAGTGMTTGVNVMPVTLSADPASGALLIGGQGQVAELHVLAVSEDAQGQMAHDAPFAMVIEDLSPARLSASEVEILTGCAAPLRMWWQMGSGAQRSWGALMFVSTDQAFGFMANSAGGSRSVELRR